jgi:hypothetical protein
VNTPGKVHRGRHELDVDKEDSRVCPYGTPEVFLGRGYVRLVRVYLFDSIKIKKRIGISR